MRKKHKTQNTSQRTTIPPVVALELFTSNVLKKKARFSSINVK